MAISPFNYTECYARRATTSSDTECSDDEKQPAKRAYGDNKVPVVQSTANSSLKSSERERRNPATLDPNRVKRTRKAGLSES